MSLDLLHHKLVTHITRQDQKDQARAMRTGRHFNHYALGIMLGAAQRVEEEAAAEGGTGRAWLAAVMRNFNATRTMHTFLKKIDPTIGVERGRWVWSR